MCNAILSYLKQKVVLSELEKDIFSTLDKYMERTFDRKGIEQKVMENNSKYLEILVVINTLPGIQSKPFIELTDEEVHNSLFLQIDAMWAKNMQ